MELRNRYYCHSDWYIITSFNMLNINKTFGLMLAASSHMRIRALNNENIGIFKIYVDKIKINITREIRELEVKLIREITG